MAVRFSFEGGIYRYEYGATTDSRVYPDGSATPYAWKLNKVTDANGNTYTIAYANGGGTAAPQTISWAPTSAGATTYLYTATFIYSELRFDKDSYNGYVSNYPVSDRRRLDRIQVSSSGQVVRSYQFTYDTGPATQRSRLTEVKECSDAQGTNCLAPTTIGYQAGVPGVSAASASAPAGGGVPRKHKYDFNGDNRDDLLVAGGIAFATTGGFTAPIAVGTSGRVGRFIYGNQHGILGGAASTYTGWNGTSFVTSSTGVTASFTVHGDLNGDGLADLVRFAESGSGASRVGSLYFRLNTTAEGAAVPTFGPEQLGLANFPLSSGTASIVSSIAAVLDGHSLVEKQDYDGDGRHDIMIGMSERRELRPNVFQDFYYHQAFLARDNGFVARSKSSETSTSPLIDADIKLFDFNGDRCTDRLIKNTIRPTMCDGSLSAFVTAPQDPIAILDWDGDGKSDFIVNNGGSIGVYRSTGTGLSALESTAISYSPRTWFSADMDGDGLDELLHESASAPYAVSFYTKNGSGQTAVSATNIPDLAVMFTDGYGNRHQPNYTTTSISDYTPGAPSRAALRPISSPLLIVNQVTSSDGIGGSFNKAYSYVDGRVIDSRPEPPMFRQRIEIDTRTGLKWRSTYEQQFPYHGFVYREELLKSNGAQIRVRTNNYLSYYYNVGTLELRTYPYIDNSVEAQSDLNTEGLISTTTCRPQKIDLGLWSGQLP